LLKNLTATKCKVVAGAKNCHYKMRD